MNCLSNLFFSPWLSRNERGIVKEHTWKNFTYVKYKACEKSGEYLGRLNKVTKEVMWADQPTMISFKCILVTFLATPLDFIIRSTFYSVRLLISCAQIFFKSIYSFLDDFGERKIFSSFYEHIMRGLVFGICKTVAKDIHNIAKVAFYCIGIVFAGVGGILMDPLRARRRIGFMVNKLNQGTSVNEYRQMLRQQKAKDPDFDFLKCLQSFYTAECMQPWLNDINQKGWRELARSDKLEEVKVGKEQECPCARWAILPIIPCCV
jgi:hypothetical protein